ncbi:MAG: YcxB family protein [Bacteroidota bacterium]
MTETKPFTQEKKTYFTIVLKTALRRRWWMYVLVLFVTLGNFYLYAAKGRSSHLVWALVGLGYFIYIFVYLYRFSYSKDKEDFLSEKQLFFNDDALRIEESAGGFGEIPYHRIHKVVDESDFWMLYLSKNQFVYIPKDIFYSETDYERFRQLIHTTGNEV